MNRIRNSFYKHNWLKNLLNKNLAKSGLKKAKTTSGLSLVIVEKLWVHN